MAVGRPAPETCLECHAREAEEHYAYAEVKCATCHLPLAGAPGLPVSRIAEPRPSNHAAVDFLLTHGADASADASACAVCHGRESCERCHLDAASEPAIAGLASDARIAQLVAGRPGEWPEPASHEREELGGEPQGRRASGRDRVRDLPHPGELRDVPRAGRPAVAASLATAAPEDRRA